MRAADPLKPRARRVYLVRYQRPGGAVAHRFYQVGYFAQAIGQRMRSRGARVVVYAADLGDWTEQRVRWHDAED